MCFEQIYAESLMCPVALPDLHTQWHWVPKPRHHVLKTETDVLTFFPWLRGLHHLCFFTCPPRQSPFLRALAQTLLPFDPSSLKPHDILEMSHCISSFFFCMVFRGGLENLSSISIMTRPGVGGETSIWPDLFLSTLQPEVTCLPSSIVKNDALSSSITSSSAVRDCHEINAVEGSFTIYTQTDWIDEGILLIVCTFSIYCIKHILIFGNNYKKIY